MKKYFTLLFLMIGLVRTATAAPSLSDEGKAKYPGWHKWAVKRVDLPSLDVYGVVNLSKKKPVLLMIQGSKCYPLFREKEGKIVSPLFSIESKFYEKLNVQAIAIERRGIRSFESIPKEILEKDPRTRCSKEYGGLTKQDRVRDVLDAIHAIRNESWFGQMMILGHSEGVDVVTAVAKALAQENILALGLLSGAAPSNFFDFIVENRKKNHLNRVQSTFDDLIWITSDQAEGKYAGYPVERYRSFFVETSNLDEALTTEVPLFVANGTLDQKTPVEGADLFVVEVLRKQPKRSVYYLNFSSLDHDFVDQKGKDQSDKVFQQFVSWSLNSKKQRKFEIQ